MDIQPIGNAVAQSVPLPVQPVALAGASAAAPPPATAATLQQSQSQSDPAQLTQAVATINQTMQTLAPGLEFSIDQESNRTIVKVVDKQTNELIRQMPSAETLEIAKALDRVQGLLISLRA